MVIYGKNAVRESIRANRVKTLYVLDRFSKDELVAMARDVNINVKFKTDGELTSISRNPSHQGFAAIVEDVDQFSIDDIISASKKKDGYPLVLMLDGIEDPHNLGAILRSVDAFGVDGVVIKNKGEVGINSTVAKVSTGAINWVKIAVVPNLTNAIKTLKDNGFWVVGSDGEASSYYDEIDYKCPIVLVIGSEGRGISQLVLKNCDFVTKIPMVGHVNSLNASVATAIYLSEIFRSRK